MKNQVKKFSQYIKEADNFGMRGSNYNAGDGIAIWKIYDYNSEVTFAGKSIQLDDDDSSYDAEGNFIAMNKVFRAATELGASPDMVWSEEDGKLIFRESSSDDNRSDVITMYVDEVYSFSDEDMRRIRKMNPNQMIKLTGAVETIASGLYGDLPPSPNNTYSAGELAEWFESLE